MIPHRRKLCLRLLLTLLLSPAAFAAVDDASLTNSIVSLQIYEGGNVVQEASGFVVQGDRFNGYIVTNATLIRDAESLTVSVPGRGGQLVAQVLESDLAADYALLKVNGLDLPALQFSRNEPSVGEVVWTAAKLGSGENAGVFETLVAKSRVSKSRVSKSPVSKTNVSKTSDTKVGAPKVSVSKGLLRTGFKLRDSDTGWFQHTAQLPGTGGAVLLNDCGQVLGLNYAQPAADGSVRALDLTTLKRMLGKNNVKLQRASEVCVSDVLRATEKAETASIEAQLAQADARKAQTVARQLEQQLSASQKTNANLERQTRIARERSESALRAAEEAGVRADNTRRALEDETTVLRGETQSLLEAFEVDRLQSLERFENLLESQQEAADSREKILLGLSGVLMVVLAIVLFFARQRSASSRAPAVFGSGQGENLPSTEIHREALSEYVLDGRDDDGIRYLLRISGDQLVDQDGVVIGRNPKDSPYIINHADVSRKHARIRVKNHRVFIEDLGSTNGTSVNGQSIDDKGPVSVSSGDQIIIGSVVMKLRVMEG